MKVHPHTAANSLPLLVFALGVAGVTVGLWLSRGLGLIEECSVYFEGCLSISASGRQTPAVYFFRAALLPMTVLMMVVWYLCGQWLRSAGLGSAASRAALMACGIVAPPFLMVYVILIGIDSEILHQIRQLSIRVYFPLAIVAKILCGVLLVRQLRSDQRGLVPRWLALTMLITAAGMLLAAILSVVLQHAMADPSRAHNLLQWHTTTVFIGWYVLLWLAWRTSGFSIHFTVTRPAQDSQVKSPEPPVATRP